MTPPPAMHASAPGDDCPDRSRRPRRRPLWRLAAHGLVAGAGLGVVLAAIAPLVSGAPVGAQTIASFDSRAPVSYAADRIELREREQRVILSGNVVIEQGDLRFTAARTMVSYQDNGALSIERINATGDVTVTRGDERAQGAAGVYDFNERVIVLSGGVRLQRGTDTMRGGRLTIDLVSGLSSMDGAGAPPRPGPMAESGQPIRPGLEDRPGRVAGTFMVPEQRN